MKVALFLEEADLAYEAIPLDTRKVSSMNRVTLRLIRMRKHRPSSTVMPSFLITTQSSNISERRRARFMTGDTPEERATLLSWLMFVASGIGPYSGQAVHFKVYAPEEFHTP